MNHPLRDGKGHCSFRTEDACFWDTSGGMCCIRVDFHFICFSKAVFIVTFLRALVAYVNLLFTLLSLILAVENVDFLTQTQFFLSMNLNMSLLFLHQ